MTQRQIPGGPYVNETATQQRQIPGGPYINEVVGGAPPSVPTPTFVGPIPGSVTSTGWRMRVTLP